jgi:hypothetical protein
VRHASGRLFGQDWCEAGDGWTIASVYVELGHRYSQASAHTVYRRRALDRLDAVVLRPGELIILDNSRFAARAHSFEMTVRAAATSCAGPGSSSFNR